MQRYNRQAQIPNTTISACISASVWNVKLGLQGAAFTCILLDFSDLPQQGLAASVFLFPCRFMLWWRKLLSVPGQDHITLKRTLSTYFDFQVTDNTGIRARDLHRPALSDSSVIMVLNLAVTDSPSETRISK